MHDPADAADNPGGFREGIQAGNHSGGRGAGGPGQGRAAPAPSRTTLNQVSPLRTSKMLKLSQYGDEGGTLDLGARRGDKEARPDAAPAYPYTLAASSSRGVGRSFSAQLMLEVLPA